MINGKNVMVRKKLIKLSDLSFPNNIFVTLNIPNIIKIFATIFNIWNTKKSVV